MMFSLLRFIRRKNTVFPAIVLMLGSSLTQAELQLNGIAEYNQLRTSYYVAALYLQEKSANPKAIMASHSPAKMELSIITSKWRNRSFSTYVNSQFSINNSKSITQKYASVNSPVNVLAGLAQATPLLAGDVISIEYSQQGITVLSLNGQPFSSDQGKTLFNALLNMWIGKRPPSRQFKADILTLADAEVTADTFEIYHLLSPKPKRLDFAKTIAIGVTGFSAEAIKLDKSSQHSNEQQKALDKAKTQALAEAASQAEAEALAITAATAKDKADAIARAKASGQAAMAKAVEEQAAEMEQERLAKAAEQARVKKSRIENEYRQQKLAQQEIALQQKRAILEYKTALRLKVTQKIRYPARAYELGQQGTVVLEITSNATGKVLSSKVHTQSPYKSLDKAAKKAGRKVKPETFNKLIKVDTITTLVRVVFVH
ncbi:MAG: TonB family protein [Pseudomonadales bacterium]|nr:TonB family protein [Pseudomonadales bacterium]